MLTHLWTPADQTPGRAWTLLRLFWIAVLCGLACCSTYLYGQNPAQPASASSPSARESTSPPSAADAPPPAVSKNLFSFITDGGYLMIPLVGCSFVLLVFTFERFISLHTARIIPGPFVKRLIQQLGENQLDKEQALLVCAENGSIAARVLAAGVKKWGRSAAEMEQALIDAGERGAHELRRFLRVFNSLATIGPLLGLLGTVFGIIQAFKDIAAADAPGRMEMLSHSISEALLTTATGLAVAIPAVAFYMYFASRVDRLLIRLDALGQELVELISAEALQERARPAKLKKAA
ncbi:MAG: MotA/TolQ/ExbB proton channel family protein [Pirellulales bacterium]|nr:MotA/TolQ/ExbB proton channel family protein [Pirellulales bacterium]